MRRNFLIMFCLFLLLILPGMVSADCMSVGNFDSFIVQDDTITLYSGDSPLVNIEVDCEVLPTSKIRLLKSYVCDDDDIMIDGSTCNIESLVSASED